MLFNLRTLPIVLLLCIPLLSHAQIQVLTQEPNLIQLNSSSTLYANAPVSKQQAAGIAQQQVPGRVLKVTLEGSIYRVKIVSESGDVVDVFVDSNTGEILSQ